MSLDPAGPVTRGRAVFAIPYGPADSAVRWQRFGPSGQEWRGPDIPRSTVTEPVTRIDQQPEGLDEILILEPSDADGAARARGLE